MVSKKISICWRSLSVITWPEYLTVREKITSQVLHNKNSRMNPWSSSFAIHVYTLVDYSLSYIFSSFWSFTLLYPSRLGWVGAVLFWNYVTMLFLNIIRLISDKMRSLSCTQKQNIQGNWWRFRNLRRIKS